MSESVVAAFFAVLSLGTVVAGVDSIQYGRRGADTSVRCSPASERCLRREQGVVERPPGKFEIGVRYDDGRGHLGVNVDGDWTPALGTRVVLERLRGNVVSVYDPSHERRHKTAEWPSEEYTVLGVVLVGVGSLVFGLTAYLLVTSLSSSLRARGTARAGRA
jgi:hypothetical protein